MTFRSLLFVPADRPERFEKAATSGADAIILDLEDSVVPERKATGRQAVAAWLSGPRPVPTFVRTNPLSTPFFAEDCAALSGQTPDGWLLPKAEGTDDVRAFVAALPGAPVLPIATETPRAVFALGEYTRVANLLLGLTWGAEDLPAAMGALSSRDEAGQLTAPYQLARSLTLFGAHAAGVPAIETVYPDIADEDGLVAYVGRARRDGFSGMMAIHPKQVAVINAGFTPSPEELDRARAIVAAFAAAPEAGALQIDGKMVDAPHLKAAQRLLAGS